MVSKTELKQRDRLAYLALYYAIHGEDERSEQIRRRVRQQDQSLLDPVPVYRESAVV